MCGCVCVCVWIVCVCVCECGWVWVGVGVGGCGVWGVFVKGHSGVNMLRIFTHVHSAAPEHTLLTVATVL